MYLLKATPEQIAKHWPLLKFSIAESFPPMNVPTEDSLLRILQLAMSGKMQIWFAYKSGYPIKSIGVATTSINLDLITGVRGLLIFSAYVWDKMGLQDWEDGFETFKTFALSEQCSRIELYTANPQIKDICDRLGKFTQTSYAVVQIGE